MVDREINGTLKKKTVERMTTYTRMYGKISVTNKRKDI